MKAGDFLRTCAILAAIVLSILTPATLRADLITNPSFEANDNIDLLSSSATGWGDNCGSSKFTGDILDTNFHTQGSRGVAFSTSVSSYYYENGYINLHQSVDLSGVSSLLFDAKLSVLDTDAWESDFEAAFFVDSVKKWSRQAIGTFMNQSIDVTGLIGNHTIEFRLQANSTGLADYTNRFEFDNVRVTLVPEPSGAVFLCTSVAGLLLYARRRKIQG